MYLTISFVGGFIVVLIINLILLKFLNKIEERRLKRESNARVDQARKQYELLASDFITNSKLTQKAMNEFKIRDEKDNSDNIIFLSGDPGEEIIKLSKGKFYYKGESVDDINSVYERFNEWLSIAEVERKKR